MKRPAPRPARGWRLFSADTPRSGEERAAVILMLMLHAALVVALGLAGWTLAKYWNALQLPHWQKVAFEVGIAAAMVSFLIRGVRLARRLRAHP